MRLGQPLEKCLRMNEWRYTGKRREQLQEITWAGGKQGVIGKSNSEPEDTRQREGLSTFIQLSSPQTEGPLQWLSYTEFQHLCLLCPKSPSRCPAFPSESAQPLLRPSVSPGLPAFGPNADRTVPPLSLLGQAPALAGTGYVPPLTTAPPSSLTWPWSDPSGPPPLFQGPPTVSFYASNLSTAASDKVQTLWQGLGGHSWSGRSRFLSSHHAPPRSWYSGGQFPTRDRRVLAT